MRKLGLRSTFCHAGRDSAPNNGPAITTNKSTPPRTIATVPSASTSCCGLRELGRSGKVRPAAPGSAATGAAPTARAAFPLLSLAPSCSRGSPPGRWGRAPRAALTWRPVEKLGSRRCGRWRRRRRRACSSAGLEPRQATAPRPRRTGGRDRKKGAPGPLAASGRPMDAPSLACQRHIWRGFVRAGPSVGSHRLSSALAIGAG
jgi:hypothetical protein